MKYRIPCEREKAEASSDGGILELSAFQGLPWRSKVAHSGRMRGVGYGKYLYEHVPPCISSNIIPWWATMVEMEA